MPAITDVEICHSNSHVLAKQSAPAPTVLADLMMITWPYCVRPYVEVTAPVKLTEPPCHAAHRRQGQSMVGMSVVRVVRVEVAHCHRLLFTCCLHYLYLIFSTAFLINTLLHCFHFVP